jgi:hypothetical protein
VNERMLKLFIISCNKIKILHTESKSKAVGRSFGSFTRHFEIKSTNVVDHAFGLETVGGGSRGIAINPSIDFTPRLGGRPSAISIIVIPSDQESACIIT